MPDTILDRALTKITGEAGAPASATAASAGTETPVQFAAKPSFSEFLTNYATAATPVQTQPNYAPPAATTPVVATITPTTTPAYNPTPAAPTAAAPITTATPVATTPAAPPPALLTAPVRPTGRNVTWQQDQQYWRDLDAFNKQEHLGAYRV